MLNLCNIKPLTVRDIQQMTLDMIELDESLKLSTFFEMTPDLVCIAGRDGFFKKVNRAVINKLGYSETALMASPIESFIYPEDKDRTANERSALLNGKVLLNLQNRYVTKSGDIVWLEWTSVYFAEKELVFAIAKDITQKKQVELEVEKKYKKFKSLAAHFKKSIEDDRKFLANEIHEELAQLVAVLKMDIEWMNTHEPGLPEPFKGKMEHALAISELLIKTMRRISFSISPAMLEELGLNAVLEWHCKEFSVLSGIPCHFESSCNDTDFTQEIKTDFFRICQDALSNIMNHALAGNVKISLEETGGELCLTIADDGKGFDFNRQFQLPGLTRMRERAASINGHLTIEREAGKGTRICVTILK